MARINISIPDAKVAKLVSARDVHNGRVGASLSTEEYVLLLLRQGIVRDLVKGASATAKSTITAQGEALRSVIRTSNIAMNDLEQNENDGW